MKAARLACCVGTSDIVFTSDVVKGVHPVPKRIGYQNGGHLIMLIHELESPIETCSVALHTFVPVHISSCCFRETLNIVMTHLPWVLHPLLSKDLAHWPEKSLPLSK